MSTVAERAAAWIVGRDTGASSKAIWAVMMGQKGDGSHPHDGDDLGRCVRLLDAIPEWKGRLPEMAAVSPYWAKLVEHWPELTARLAQDRQVYERMRQLLDPIEKADRNVIRLSKHVSVRIGR